MQFGKAIVGAIIGAVIGIAILIAVQHYLQRDQIWLAIVVALVVGLGVRTMVSTSGHPSIARGALTCVLALVAYYGGTQIYSELARREILAKKLPALPIAHADEGAKTAEEGDDAKTEAEPEPVEPAADQRAARTVRPADNPRVPLQAPSPWDYLWLSIAALLAYELGRGTAPAAPKGPIVPPPDAT
jgi:hypothetical protein